jgi:hypothetical protein
MASDLTSDSSLLIGFDLRIPLDEYDAPEWLINSKIALTGHAGLGWSVSLDRLVWPRWEDLDAVGNSASAGAPARNIADLLNANVDLARASTPLYPEWPVAAVLTTSNGKLAVQLRATLANDGSLQQLLDSADWKHLGFEVLDCDLSFSPLLNMGQEVSRKAAPVLAAFPGALNAHWLWTSWDAANAFVLQVSSQVPTHAPFEIVKLFSTLQPVRIRSK